MSNRIRALQGLEYRLFCELIWLHHLKCTIPVLTDYPFCSSILIFEVDWKKRDIRRLYYNNYIKVQ